MSISVSDMLTLKSFEHFALIAGKSGLSKTVEVVDMLDFGWERDQTYSQTLFEKRSFVVSSLMFAKYDPEKLFITINSMIKCGVVGLAYKPVFYKELPAEVCRLADENGFVIFRIDDNVTYREIICDVSNAVNINNDIMEAAGYLAQMLSEGIDGEQVSTLVTKISPHFQKNAKVILVMPRPDTRQFHAEQIIRSFKNIRLYRNQVTLCKFSPGIAVITTSNAWEEPMFDLPADYVISNYIGGKDAVLLASSNIHPTYPALHLCLREAYCTLVAAKVLNKDKLSYGMAGTFSYLIPMAGNSHLQSYYRNYLAPVLTDTEYMQTAAAFIRADGDYEKAAAELGYHKNTMRYRINKIKSHLSPDLPYEAFYENLAAAVKIYLINEMLSDTSFIKPI